MSRRGAAPVLLLGGTGLLGLALAAELRSRERRFEAPTRSALDLAAPGGLEEAVASMRPSAVINAAAFTDVSEAERPERRDEVEAVNAVAPGALARGAARAGAGFVQVSTDYVFDGRSSVPWGEDDPPLPLQAYGRTKLAGERAVLAAHPGALVVRTSMLFGNGRCRRTPFVRAVLLQARHRASLEVEERPICSPTFAPDLAAALVDLLDRGTAGLLHVANAGRTGRTGLARAVLDLAGFGPAVTVRPRSEPPGGPPRPTCTVLDTARHAALAGAPLRPWRDALAACLEVPEP